MILSIKEIIDLIIMTLFVGFIFSDVFKKPRMMMGDFPQSYSRSFDFENFKFAALVTAPAIIFHEFGHKIIAILFGMNATFHAAYTWLGLGLLLKLMNFGFIFFVPAFVSIQGVGTPLEYSIIALAGPLVNLIIWLGTSFLLKNRIMPRKYQVPLQLTKQINMFLFIFNMLPIPGFDGFKVYEGLFRTIF